MNIVDFLICLHAELLKQNNLISLRRLVLWCFSLLFIMSCKSSLCIMRSSFIHCPCQVKMMLQAFAMNFIDVSDLMIYTFFYLFGLRCCTLVAMSHVEWQLTCLLIVIFFVILNCLLCQLIKCWWRSWTADSVYESRSFQVSNSLFLMQTYWFITSSGQC